MTCAKCHRELEPDSVYCRSCGAPVSAAASARSLVRLPAEGKVAGVCAGLASYFDADVTLVRLVWVALSIVPGVLIGGVIAYVAAWLLVPVAAPAERRTVVKRLTRSDTDKVIAGVCGGLADYFRLDPTIVRLAVVIVSIYPGAIIGGLVGYIVAWLIMPPERGELPVPSAM